MARSELAQRVIVAAVGIPLVVLALYLGRWVMGPVLALFCAGAAWEIYRLAERKGIRPIALPGAVAAGSVILLAMTFPSVHQAAPWLWTGTLLLLLILSLAAIWERGTEGQPLVAVAVTVFGAILPAGALSYAIFLRHLPVGPNPTDMALGTWRALVGVALVAYPLAITWVSDSAAYFAGRRWGRRRLMPSVSPNKTVLGAVAGLGGGLLAGWVVARFVYGAWLGVPLDPLAGAAGGILIGAIAQAGDLAESAWKRAAGVKDSGTFFPGHGGILDRMDSLLFTIPAAYWWLALLLR